MMFSHILVKVTDFIFNIMFVSTAGWSPDPTGQETEGEPFHTKQPSFRGQHPKEQEQGRHYARIL